MPFEGNTHITGENQKGTMKEVGGMRYIGRQPGKNTVFRVTQSLINGAFSFSFQINTQKDH